MKSEDVAADQTVTDEGVPRMSEARSVAAPISNDARPIIIEVRVRLQAFAFPEPAGGFSVIVPALPGCVTEGDDVEDVQANIVEAAEGWLLVSHEQNREEALRLIRE